MQKQLLSTPGADACRATEDCIGEPGRPGVAPGVALGVAPGSSAPPAAARRGSQSARARRFVVNENAQQVIAPAPPSLPPQPPPQPRERPPPRLYFSTPPLLCLYLRGNLAKILNTHFSPSLVSTRSHLRNSHVPALPLFPDSSLSFVRVARPNQEALRARQAAAAAAVAAEAAAAAARQVHHPIIARMIRTQTQRPTHPSPSKSIHAQIQSQLVVSALLPRTSAFFLRSLLSSCLKTQQITAVQV